MLKVVSYDTAFFIPKLFKLQIAINEYLNIRRLPSSNFNEVIKQNDIVNCTVEVSEITNE